MTDTVFTVQALARDAEAQDWYWSHDYYKRQAMHMREIMLPYDYYVKGDLKKTPHK
jgi:heme/copper-type cytochrome/quinol oxidase subunit 2